MPQNEQIMKTATKCNKMQKFKNSLVNNNEFIQFDHYK